MKKIYTTLALCSLAVTSAMAQQLPNVGFQGEWVESYPWNSICNNANPEELSMKAALSRMGNDSIFTKQPQGWTASNVLGVVSTADDGSLAALGSTVVADSVAGYNSTSALKLTNRPNPFMSTQIVPAYVSLGTSWATNTLKGFFQVSDKDGGVFGGLEFAQRPDELQFYYQKADNENGEGQKATALVYAWKGTWTQDSVPANNSMGATAVKVTMTDRDRNILDMTTDQGGKVSKTEDALLIAKSLKYIEGTAGEWTKYSLPIEYLSDEAPAKINVVLAANDYFDSQNIVNGNSFTVDDVKFIYYSRLAAASFGGKAVEGFDADKFDYELDGAMPATDDYSFELLGQGKSATIAAKAEGNTMTVTVANANGADTDGAAEHVYTFVWKGEAPAAETVKYEGKLTIEMFGSDITEGGMEATIEITPTGETSCNFVLPNFQLDLGGGPMPLGDIVVNNVATSTVNGETTYTGNVKDFKLMGGAIVADIDLNGITNEAGDADMNIDVNWNNEGTMIPIKVVFTGKKTTGVAGIVADENAPVEYFNLQGVRVANPENGLYLRRQGNKVNKVLVK